MDSMKASGPTEARTGSEQTMPSTSILIMDPQRQGRECRKAGSYIAGPGLPVIPVWPRLVGSLFINSLHVKNPESPGSSQV